MKPLSFLAVDDLSFASFKQRALSPLEFEASELGPLLELAHMAGDTPSNHSVRGMLEEFWLNYSGGHSRAWVKRGGSAGFWRLSREFSRDWTAFRVEAHKAALGAGFGKAAVAQLIGGFGEIVDNIAEHSGAVHTGVAAYHGGVGHFEFVVLDRGIGPLQSLRTCEEFKSLADHGAALRLVLTDGISRFGVGSGRGTGFRNLFRGLADINGSLRFRAGDHALTIEGHGPKLEQARLVQKVQLTGFLASVTCRVV